jgi:DNA-binding NarL/FixJ family response regulator
LRIVKVPPPLEKRGAMLTNLGNSPSTILLVEDHAQYRETLKTILQSRFPEIAIFEAEEGSGVARMVDEHQPGMIFMDIRLPGISGLELTKVIKQHHPEIVIAVLTNLDTPEYEEAAYSNGADYFLSKQKTRPGDIEDLVVSVLGI